MARPWPAGECTQELEAGTGRHGPRPPAPPAPPGAPATPAQGRPLLGHSSLGWGLDLSMSCHPSRGRGAPAPYLSFHSPGRSRGKMLKTASGSPPEAGGLLDVHSRDLLIMFLSCQGSWGSCHPRLPRAT